jgi:repressor LexA
MPQRISLPDRVRALREFVSGKRRMPGYSEMLEIFGVRSKNAVFGILLRMQREGYIQKDPAGRLSPTARLTAAVRLLGIVRAGFPSPAEEELLDTLSLDEFLIERPEATFLLRVEGDSMIDAGIHPGDMVLVEKGTPPRNHDIVIAQVDGEWTMKYFHQDGNGVRLEPANRRYGVIRPRQTLEVAEVVRCVIRKY